MSVTAVPLQPVKKSYKVWLWAGLVLAIAIAIALAWTGTRASVQTAYNADQFMAWHKGQAGVKTTASGLQYQVLTEGTGKNAADGDGVVMNVVGKKRDGEIFQPDGPLRMLVGQGIPGFNEALKLMNKGAKLRVWIPPVLGYEQAGPQHPLYGQVLIFDIEANEIVPAAIIQQMMMQQQLQQQQGGAPGGPGGPGGLPQGGPEGDGAH
jgi:FKBP-type peptidyl-prolyl cis-trans isomerase FkpA